MDVGPNFLVPGGALSGPLFARLLYERDAVAALPPGTLVGKYRVVEIVGRGGSSVVYRADRDDGEFDQTVALKVVRSDPRLRDFLHRERNILGMLSHPGIARIIDGGETPAGEPWYTMEFVQGQRIDAWCTQHRAQWRDVVRLMVAVCDAVAYAHAVQIVHGDIKPSNILVDEQGFPRLLDFGISRELSAPERGDEGLAFTPGFASPEQMLGLAPTIVSDIYQLGRVLDVLLAGGHCARTLRGVHARNLAVVINQATSQQPVERYATVERLRADLLRARQAQPAAAKKLRLPDRVVLYVSRNTIPVVIAALGFCVAAGLLIRHEIGLRAERAIAEEETGHALIANEILASVFRTGASSASEERLTAREIMDRGVQNALHRFDDAPGQRAIAVESLASVYLDSGDVARAKQLIGDSLAGFDQQGQGLERERGVLRVQLARIAAAERRLADAHADIARAESLLGAMPSHPLDYAKLEAARVAILVKEGDRVHADPRRDALLEHMATHHLGDTLLFASILVERAGEREQLGEVLSDLERAQTIVITHLGPTSPQALRLERKRIWALWNGGDSLQGDQLIAAHDRIVKDTFGEQSLEYSDVLRFEGFAAFTKEDFAGARPLFEQSYAIVRAALGPDDKDVATAAHNLGDVLRKLGRLDDALQRYEEALRIRRLRFAEDHQPTLMNVLQIAKVQCSLGRYDAANMNFIDATGRLAKRLGETHSDVVVGQAEYALCLERQGRIDEARSLVDTVLKPERNNLTPTNQATVDRAISAVNARAIRP